MTGHTHIDCSSGEVSTTPLSPEEVAANEAAIAAMPDETTFELQQNAAAVRVERDRLLASTDWTQLVDAPVDSTAWATYRQALRDVPEQADFPVNVEWPVKPE